MYRKYWIGLFATSYAIVFTMLVYLMSNYDKLWLSLEVIVLPIIYYMGYEILMDKQKKDFDNTLEEMYNYASELEKENARLKKRRVLPYKR